MLAVERPKRRVMVAADASGISVHARILPREDGSRPSVLRRKMSMIARYSAYHVHVCSVCPLKTKASAQLGGICTGGGVHVHGHKTCSTR